MLAVSRGFNLEWILQLDLLCFRSLIRSIKRLDTEQRIVRIWDTYVAAQGGHKDVQKHVKMIRGDEDNSEELAKLLAQNQ